MIEVIARDDHNNPAAAGPITHQSAFRRHCTDPPPRKESMAGAKLKTVKIQAAAVASSSSAQDTVTDIRAHSLGSVMGKVGPVSFIWSQVRISFQRRSTAGDAFGTIGSRRSGVMEGGLRNFQKMHGDAGEYMRKEIEKLPLMKYE